MLYLVFVYFSCVVDLLFLLCSFEILFLFPFGIYLTFAEEKKVLHYLEKKKLTRFLLKYNMVLNVYEGMTNFHYQWIPKD